MPLLYIKRYTRALIQQQPDWLFVFGDNLAGVGYGGQAREARGEPNAIGIATKKSPHMTAGAFLTNDDFMNWKASEEPKLRALKSALEAGKVVVWPLDGIGTGLAELEKYAPYIAIRLNVIRRTLEKIEAQ